MSERIGIPSEDTRTDILKYLLSKDLTAVELSRELGINESAVRRHLDILEKKGLIEHYFEKAIRGRPKKYYRITKGGEGLFPSRSDFLLESVLDAMVDTYGEKSLDKIEDCLIDRITSMLSDLDDSNKFHNKVEAIARMFDDMGFYASHEFDDGEHYLRYENCAFSDLSERYASWLCNIHCEVVKNALGDIELEQIRSAAQGDKICIQKVGER